MKRGTKIFTSIIIAAFALIQTTLADIVVEKDAVGPTGAAMFTTGGMLLIITAIAVVWAISLTVIKVVRNKNVNK